MGVHIEQVRYGSAREHSGYLAVPERAKTPLPAVIVLQEAWGVSGHIDDVAQRFAMAGYVALAPDLYATHGVRPLPLTRDRMAMTLSFLNELPPRALADPKLRDEELARLDSPQREQIGETIKDAFAAAGNLEALVPRVVAAAAFLRDEHPRSRGQAVGAVGFCMGGGLAIRLACNDPQLKAAAMFYGSLPAPEQAAKITCPMLGFFGQTDKRFADPVPAFAAQQTAAGKVFEAHLYEGAGHAFFNDTRPSYEVRAARDAFARTLELFRRTLA